MKLVLFLERVVTVCSANFIIKSYPFALYYFGGNGVKQKKKKQHFESKTTSQKLNLGHVIKNMDYGHVIKNMDYI